MAKRTLRIAVKCCKQSPAISVINELWQSHSVDNICDATRNWRKSNKRP